MTILCEWGFGGSPAQFCHRQWLADCGFHWDAGLTAGSRAGAASELGEGDGDRAVKTPPSSLLLLRVGHFS